MRCLAISKGVSKEVGEAHCRPRKAAASLEARQEHTLWEQGGLRLGAADESAGYRWGVRRVKRWDMASEAWFVWLRSKSKGGPSGCQKPVFVVGLAASPMCTQAEVFGLGLGAKAPRVALR